MGEIADMMLDGSMCELCGEYLGEGDGYTRLCAGCSEDAPPPKAKKKRKQRSSQVSTPRRDDDATR